MSLGLPTPTLFSAFPYDPPYGIQTDLMRHVYAAIEERKVDIVESPTGTGKTLSLLCASLTWLMDEKARALLGKLSDLQLSSGNEPDWVLQHAVEQKKRELLDAEAEFEASLAKARQREEASRKMEMGRVRKRRRISPSVDDIQDLNEDRFLPNDFDMLGDEPTNLSPAVLLAMKKLDDSRAKESSVGPNSVLRRTKVFYASRTHSQLSQVVSEVRKLKFKATTGTGTPESSESHKDIAVVSLASRKHLCINEDVRSKRGNIDDECRELLNEQGTRRCPYLPSADEESRMIDFRDRILAVPTDIEDLVEAGKSSKVCPYFGSRNSIPLAELVVLPYNYLLQSSARDALEIDLTDQIIVIDEAHNLTEAILHLHAAHLPASILRAALQQLTIYLKKFRNRLSAVHLLHIKRLWRFLDAVEKYAKTWRSDQTSKADEIISIREFVDRLGQHVGGINLLEIYAYLKSSKIARKISKYSEKADQETANVSSAKLHADLPLYTVESFIMALSNAQDDGCLVISSDETTSEVTFKYQHLNPSTYFDKVVSSARSVVLAGGTMSPTSHITMQLVPQLSAINVSTFSCDHVIPSTNLSCLVLGKGPGGKALQLKYAQRGDESIVKEIGQILSNLVNVVPNGIVVFFPSYSFLNLTRAIWTKDATLSKLDQRKKVFFEPHDSHEVDQVLVNYQKAVYAKSESGKGGALLFAVVGAKLSEGLNFADELARAVVIIGLPFANLGSLELKARIEYVKKKVPSPHSGVDAGMEFYENMCMKAVNQSIGRAIRHQKDWASLILIDERYGNKRIREQLPQWIGKSLTVTENFGHAMRLLGLFNKSKRS